MSDRTVRVSLTLQMTNYLAGMEKARRATAETGTAAEKAARQIEDQKQAMDSAAKGLMAGGLVATAATALSVKAAIGWQSAWAGVTKTVDGTPAQLQQVEDGLRSLSKTLPSSHDEIAAVAEAAGQLGIQTGNVVAFTNTMIDLGETTNLSADEAATSLARFMNIMGTSQDQVSNLGSTIVALGNNYATTEAEIVGMSMRLAGAGRQIGLSEGEVLGLSTALSSVGIEAEAGGSAFSTLMVNIASEVETGGDKLELFAKTSGQSANEFTAQWKKDPAAALTGFIQGLGSVEDQGGSTLQVLADLGVTEIRMRDALLRSSAASTMFAKAMGDGNEAFDENNALAAEAAMRYATVESQLQITSNKVSDAAISFGEVFLPAVSAASGAVGDMADGLGALDPTLQGTLASVVLVGGAVSLAGGGFLLAVPKIAAYQSALAVLSTSTMPGVASAVQMVTGATARSGAALASAATFMTGPLGVSLAAATVGVVLLGKAFDSLAASSSELQNTAKTAKNIDELLATFSQGKAPLVDLKAELSDIPNLLEQAANKSKNWGANWNTSGEAGITVLRSIGTELSSLVGSDLAAAQSSFRLLSKETDGSAQSQWRLLSTMSDYKDALTDQATSLGINVTSSNEAANKTALLKLAFGDATPVATSAATAYLEAADQASTLADEVLKLTDLINAANGVGQDAVSSNASYQESLAGITAKVDSQKEAFIKLQEDAYQEANGSLEGFVSTLDGFGVSLNETTEAGSANSAMLARVAADAQDAALAQYEVDKTTLSAKDATDKYIGTLAASREELRLQAEANGFSAGEVQNLIDKVYALPTQREVAILAETAGAQADLDQFMANNASRRITIQTALNGPGAGVGVLQRADAAPFAAGGAVSGAGTATSDSIVARLSNNEHVFTASDVDAMGGQSNVYAFRKTLHRGYAKGGEVGFGVHPQYVQSGHTYGGNSSAVTNHNRGGDTYHVAATDPHLIATVVESRRQRKEWSER
jgi:TP901 family phage tail tape measure protein